VRQADGEYGAVLGVEFINTVQRMYNLTVASAHTFFVGRQSWLVHNCDDDLIKQASEEVDNLIKQSNIQKGAGGADDVIYTHPGNLQDAQNSFNRIADPSTIQPHPNPTVANAGGLQAGVPGGGNVYLRPITRSGGPALDLMRLLNRPRIIKFHFTKLE
jgi:hypothetical protein